MQVLDHVRQFLHKLDSCEIEGNEGKGFGSNLNYFIEIVFSDYPFNVDSHVKLINFDFKGERFKMQLQGSTTLCGMCALHNTINKFYLTPHDFNSVADCLWLEMALRENLSNDFQKQRSLSGDYSIDVIISVAQDQGYECIRFDNNFKLFFQNANPCHLDENPDELFKNLLKILGIKRNDHLFIADSMNHFVTIVFLEHDMIILDSIKGPSIYSIQSGLTYLWQLSYSSGFAAYHIPKRKYVFIKDDADILQPNINFTVFEIMRHNSTVNASQEISSVFKHVTAHDVRSLGGENFINDSIICPVCQAINKSFPSVYAIDSLLATRLLNPSAMISKSQATLVPPSKDLLLLPISSGRHWWVLSINNVSSSYSVLDSLGLEHQDGVETLLKRLSFLSHNQVCEFIRKKISFPLQGSNGTQCGLFSICCMISEPNSTNFDFSLYDMDYVRQQLAYNIVNGHVTKLSSPSIWQGKSFSKQSRFF